MSARVTGVMAWHPPAPGSERHAGRIDASRPGAAPAPDLSLVNPDEWDWQDRALCAETDPAIFYPADSVSAAPALRVCAACQVRARCLEWATENDEQWGVWGGTTERERQAIRAGREENKLAA